MSTSAQINANRENAQHSTGPVTDAGRAASAHNRQTHGLAGRFNLLHWEDPAQYKQMLSDLDDEYKPTDSTEQRLVQSIGQHLWLMQRAITLQDGLLLRPELDEKRFALYLRYQTTNERAYYRAMKEMQTHRKEKAKQQIGFESQKRIQEMHEAKVRLTNARADEVEIANDVRYSMDAPLPGHARVPFEDLKQAFRATLRDLNQTLEAKLTKQAA